MRAGILLYVRVRKGLRVVAPWLRRALTVLEWGDWKTWAWATVVGADHVIRALRPWASRHSGWVVRVRHTTRGYRVTVTR